MQSHDQTTGQMTGSASSQMSGSASNQTGGAASNQTGGSSSGLGNELKSDAQQLGTTAGNRIHSELDARKGTAAQSAKSVGSAIERAAGELDEGVPQWLKSAFQQGAQQVQRLADTLENKDSREIVRDIQTMARNNPGTFLAGCAALGFATARLFKAGADGGSMSTPQQSQTRFPPAQVDEPMYRSGSSEPSFAGSTGTGTTGTTGITGTSRTGEFV